jgi:hypothetical protein
MVREFRFRPCSTVLLAALVAAACADVPTSAPSHPRPRSAAGDVIAVAAAPNAGSILVSPDQEIVIGEGEDAIVARFHSNLHIRPDGTASGSARLEYDLPDGSRRIIVVNYTEGAIDVAGGTFVARVGGDVEICSGNDCRTFPITGTISPEPIDDCLIYDILGPDVHDGEALEAEGRLILPGT